MCPSVQILARNRHGAFVPGDFPLALRLCALIRYSRSVSTWQKIKITLKNNKWICQSAIQSVALNGSAYDARDLLLLLPNNRALVDLSLSPLHLGISESFLLSLFEIMPTRCLSTVKLSGRRICTDQTVEALCRHHGETLQSLSLDASQLTLLGFSALKQLPNLRHLSLEHGHLTLQMLQALPSDLLSLEMNQISFDAADSEKVLALKSAHLLSLSLHSMHVPLAAIMRQATRLKHLDLNACDFNADLIDRLPSCLQSIDFSCTSITPNQLKRILTQLPDLVRCNVYGCSLIQQSDICDLISYCRPISGISGTLKRKFMLKIQV